MSESTGPDNCCRRWAVLQETGMFRSVVLWLLVCGFVLFVQGPRVKGEPELSTTPNLLIFRISFFPGIADILQKTVCFLFIHQFPSEYFIFIAFPEIWVLKHPTQQRETEILSEFVQS